MGEVTPNNTMETESLQNKDLEGNKLKSKEVVENPRKEIKKQMIDKNLMEINNPKEDLSAEEQVMKHLLQAWRHLDECFILEDQSNSTRKLFNNRKKNKA